MSKEQLDNLHEIRNLMEKSSRFLSLSGLSGISTGIIALIGATVAFFHLGFGERYLNINQYFYIFNRTFQKFQADTLFLILDGLAMLVLALAAGIYFTVRRARKKGLRIWDNTTRRVLINLLLPLTSGGLFCIILLYHGIAFLVAPATLLFYGLALINASKYTLQDIRYLGISEIVLGLMGSVFVGYGLVIWAFGFGILHIVYGTGMYFKYEK